MPSKSKAAAVAAAASATTAPSNLRTLTPTKPIRETYTLVPGVKVTVVASPDRWPHIKKDGAYVSIDAAPAEANPTRDARDTVQSSGRSGGRQRQLQPHSSQELRQDQSGDHIPGATVTASLPGDEDVAEQVTERMAAGMDLTSESVKFLRQAERSIMRKEEL